MFLVISCSLNPASRSRLLARRAMEYLGEAGQEATLFDLQESPLPHCDAGACYGDANVQAVANLIREATGVLIASPIYNYDLNSAAKNLIELTGKAWTNKVVGFLCAAGGQTSYMSVMGLANSLMLDFRSFILPRFVYTDGRSFDETSLQDPAIEERLQELTTTLVRVGNALHE